MEIQRSFLRLSHQGLQQRQVLVAVLERFGPGQPGPVRAEPCRAAAEAADDAVQRGLVAVEILQLMPAVRQLQKCHGDVLVGAVNPDEPLQQDLCLFPLTRAVSADGRGVELTRLPGGSFRRLWGALGKCDATETACEKNTDCRARFS